MNSNYGKQLPDDLSDDSIVRSIQASAEETAAFVATSKWGYKQLKASIESRGDPFDRCGCVVFEEDGKEILRIPVSAMPATIGSGSTADFVLERAGISRLHCHLERMGCLVRVYDDASTNGIMLNKKTIEAEDLCDGDELVLGTVVLRIRKG
jgi:hypothetical protein